MKAELATLRELLRTNDLVLLSFACHVLSEAGIDFEVFDGFTSAVEGSIGALPRRLIVNDDDFIRAKAELGNASITIAPA